MSDSELLQRYLRSRSDEDFEAVVGKHAGLVLGTAVRCTGDRHLAEEVMQNVFVLLARKAAEIREPRKLAAWLHRATVLQSSNAVRMEATRRRKMKSYTELADVEVHEETGGAWKDVLPKLDRAINRLSPKDRDVLILRFYERRSFRAIGEVVQRSEDACRMRAARALARLSRMLRKEGVSVPGAALGAGLAHHLVQSVPAQRIASVSQAAVNSAGAGVANPLLVTTMSTLSSAKITAVITLVAFMAPIGVQLARNPLVRPDTSADHPAPRRSTAGVAAPAPPAAEHAAAQAGATGMSQQEIAAKMKELASHPNPDRAQAAVCRFLLGLSYAELPRALRVFPVMPGYNMGYGMTEALCMRWAEFDPVEALRIAEGLDDVSHRIGGRRGAFRTWAAAEPEAAKAYCKALDAGELRSRLEELYWSARRDQDPQAAAVEAMGIEDEAERRGVLDKIVQHWGRRDPGEAIEWLRDFPDGARRDRWLEELVIEYSYDKPERALGYADEFFSGHYHQKLLGRVLANWAFAEPEIAMGRLLELPETSRTADVVQRFAAEVADLDKAREIAGKLPEGTDRDNFIIGLTRGSQQGHFPGGRAAVAELTKMIGDEKSRSLAVRILAQGWLMRDRDTALAWIQSSEAIPPGVRETILKENSAK